MSEAVNEERGEIELELDGQRYGLRPSYTAIAEIERTTGMAIGELAQAADRQALKLDQIGSIAAVLIRAWGAAQTVPPLGAVKAGADRVAKLIVEAPGGVLMAQVKLALVLFNAATGGFTAEGEAKPAAATEGTTQETAAAG